MNDDYAHQLDLESRYRDMAEEAAREREADEWIEGLIADVPREGEALTPWASNLRRQGTQR